MPAHVKSTIQMSELRDLVTTYFKGVDDENLDLILRTLHPDCVFSVETHNVCLTSHTEITGMFLRLWSNHVSVLHDQFHFVEGRAGREIAVRFQVTNKHLDGTIVYKSNCNFFTVHKGRFDSVRVYMSGENTLNK